MRKAAPLLSILLALAGCAGMPPSPMPYQPTVPLAAAPLATPQVGQPTLAADERPASGDPTRLGTIRGGYGNPLFRLQADRPVDQVVVRAFTDALAARGLHAPGMAGRFGLAITIHQLNTDQMNRREATADFTLVLTDRSTGQAVWRDRNRVYNLEGSLLWGAPGMLQSPGGIESMRRFLLRTMSESIDQLLDKPEFRAALGA